MSEDDKAFISGVAFACAVLVRAYDQPSMAANIIASGNLSKRAFRFVDTYDRCVIYKLFRTESCLDTKEHGGTL